jgi:uncharacterized protein (TIGR00297 family)
VIILSWWIGLAGSLFIAGAAFARRSLSLSGFAAAVVLGTLMYSLGNVLWFGLLIYFFLSSTAWSKFKKAFKQQAESGYEKSGRRDAGQVWANGGLGLILCIGWYLWPHEAWWIAFLGVIATVTADTWATEIGGLSRKQPRSIRTFKKVSPGTSGGVTRLGMAASVSGALSVGLLAVLFNGVAQDSFIWSWAAIAAISGTAGALADSWLGAWWQRMNRCSACGREVESRNHCGMATMHLRGWRALSNDAVNSLSSGIGGIIALAVFYMYT